MKVDSYSLPTDGNYYERNKQKYHDEMDMKRT